MNIHNLPPNAIALSDPGHYNAGLVIGSYLLAVFGCYMAIAILRALNTTQGRIKQIGMLLGAAAMATAIWSMHYTGMLSYDMTMEHSYNPWLTILSGIVAALFALAVFYILTRSTFGYRHILIGAPLLGVGVATMHYTGMAAMRMQADMYYKPELFALSIVIAIAASGAALWIMHQVSRLRRYQLVTQFAAALVMGIAVCGMHYTGMAATIFVPYADCRFIGNQEFTALAFSVGASACLIIGLASSFLLYVRQSQSRRLADVEFKFLSKLQLASVILSCFIALAIALTASRIHILLDDVSAITIDKNGTVPARETLNRAHDLSLEAVTQAHRLLFMLLPSITALIVGVAALLQGRKLLAHAIHERSFSQNIMDAIPDPIFVKDENHVWKAGNKAFWRMMGDKPEKFLGKGDHDIFPPEQVAIFWEKDDLVIRTGVTDINEEDVNNAEGATRIALTTKTPLTLTDGTKGLVGIIHDITAQKEAERELARHRDHLQQMVEEQTRKIEEEKLTITLLQNVASIANEARTLHSALAPTLMVIGMYVGWPVGHAYVLDEKSGNLISSKKWYLEDRNKYGALKSASEAMQFASGVGIPGRVLETKRAIWASSLLDEAQYPRKNVLDQSELCSAIAFPILDAGKVIAVIEFFIGNTVEISPDLLALFDNIGAQLTIVAERERTEKAMLAAIADAEKANQLKSEFLANMSHELRTPMHSIITFSRQGIERKDRWNGEQQAENLALIRDSGERLLTLLNDLLDLSKLEAGATDYTMRPTDMTALITRSHKQLQSLLHDKQLTLDCAIANDLPLIHCDDGKITQVLFNLLSNAIKFTPVGSTIRVDCARATDDETYLHLRISDEGMGIPPNELLSVFDKFVQSSKTKTGAGGTGLGLAISKEIILGHHGTIWAENNASVGACFHIRIPIEQPTPVRRAA